ncbi:hypothetical protein ACFJIY_16440 [Pimelobacter simplex]|uniref:hypothetical protein n=1 Tax=Nocardioides simplex TaxID=2045 RepID=UPI003672D08E
MRPLAVPALLLTVVLTGCGTEVPSAGRAPAAAPGATTSPAATATTTAGPTAGPMAGGGPGITAPPPFRVRYGARELVLHPHTYCYGGGCVDGVVTEPPEVGSAAELLVHVPVRRFRLEVSLTEVRPGRQGRRSCTGRQMTAPADDLGGGWYRIRPFGPAATYDVGLFATGRGDMFAQVRWTTPAAGPMPTPAAQLALIADHDGRPDSYGLELSVSGLDRTPRRATAQVEVTAGNGRRTTITAQRQRGSCVGDLWFGAPDEVARAAARLGGFPFTTRVTLVLDGVRHVATAVHPDDEVAGNEPYVALAFTPPLPGL